MTQQDRSLLQRADVLCQSLLARPVPQEIDEAVGLLPKLRDLREFGRLCELAECVCRFRLDDAKIRRLYAQGLIETKRLALAVEFLEGALKHFDSSHSEYAELEGLLGRAYKQLLIDTIDPDGSLTPIFLDRSASAYQSSYRRDPARHFWHAINLSALARATEQRGMMRAGPSAVDYATTVLGSLDAMAASDRDQWWAATKAEAHIARGEWVDAKALRLYIDDPQTTPFSLASTLRQLRELWRIQQDAVGARLLQMLEATLVSRPDANLTVAPSHLVEMRSLQSLDDAQLQRIAGPEGRETVNWYRTGLARAGAVAAVSERLGLRFGTGFAVRGADFGVDPAEEIFLLTNFHVLNRSGLGGRSDFGNVEIAFEAAANGTLSLAPREVVVESDDRTGSTMRCCGLMDLATDWSHAVSPCDREVEDKARVYVIGYPLGDTMQFSLQDNLLLDHECAPTGHPPIPRAAPCALQSALKKASSGSPVFDKYWQCIALHHAGGKRNPKLDEYGIPGLNGSSTNVEANEGIWIGSIQDDIKAKNIRLGPAGA